MSDLGVVARKPMATNVSMALIRTRRTKAIIAVNSPPMSSTRPVPTRFRTPSASLMIREIKTPVFVESKYDTGRRRTCACTRFRTAPMNRISTGSRMEVSAVVKRLREMSPLYEMAHEGVDLKKVEWNG